MLDIDFEKHDLIKLNSYSMSFLEFNVSYFPKPKKVFTFLNLRINITVYIKLMPIIKPENKVTKSYRHMCSEKPCIVFLLMVKQ